MARPVVHVAAPWDWFSIAAVMLVVRANASNDVFMYLLCACVERYECNDKVIWRSLNNVRRREIWIN